MKAHIANLWKMFESLCNTALVQVFLVFVDFITFSQSSLLWLICLYTFKNGRSMLLQNMARDIPIEILFNGTNREKLCSAKFSTRIYQNWSLAASDLFYMFTSMSAPILSTNFSHVQAMQIIFKFMFWLHCKRKPFNFLTVTVWRYFSLVVG